MKDLFYPVFAEKDFYRILYPSISFLFYAFNLFPYVLFDSMKEYLPSQEVEDIGCSIFSAYINLEMLFRS